MSQFFPLQEIIDKLGGEVQLAGKQLDEAALASLGVNIQRVASLQNAGSGHISFVSDAKYLPMLAQCQASAIILSPDHSRLNQTALPCIVTENPYAYFARVSELLNPPPCYLPGVAASAVVDASAHVPSSCTIMANCVIGANVKLGENVVIGPGCVIEANATIAADTRLESHVVVYHDCTIGERCILAAGAVIGADGFGYANDNGRWVKIPQIGRVVIHDDVCIGANTSIDRGALDDTIIEEGVKLDNLIQIGHNCRIGAHTVIAGCVGIAGSALIGRHCRIGGAAMILGHLQIVDGVTVSPGSMITRSLNKAGTYTALMPFQAHEDWLKTAANLRKLSDLSERVKHLEAKLTEANAKGMSPERLNPDDDKRQKNRGTHE